MRRLALLASLLVPAAALAAPSEGEYLTRAADCVACHSAPGGVPYAGGREFRLPFGTLYSPNITPDRDTGIGQYSDDEWVRMLQQGIGRDGKHLYPAMPYTSYTRLTRDDALKIKAYLFSLKPVHAAAPANHMTFPFDQRWGLALWNWVNLDDKRFAPDAGKPAEWNRGAYLVEALGHCAQCHTPRDITQGLKTSENFAGAVQQGWLAYNLTPDSAHGIGGWSDAALVQYLSSGRADGHGPASGPMAEAVQNSLRYLTQADLHAMVVYLRGLKPQPTGPEATPTTAQPAAPDALGARIYAEACAGCHLPNGAGRQSAWAALGGAHSVGDPDGHNLVQVLAQGSQIETDQGLMFMHGFTGAYTDQELAALSNYVIGHFSGRAGQVQASQIENARKNAPPSNASPGS
jgi:mono/diheme cytochrome c family protein